MLQILSFVSTTYFTASVTCPDAIFVAAAATPIFFIGSDIESTASEIVATVFFIGPDTEFTISDTVAAAFLTEPSTPGCVAVALVVEPVPVGSHCIIDCTDSITLGFASVLPVVDASTRFKKPTNALEVGSAGSKFDNKYFEKSVCFLIHKMGNMNLQQIHLILNQINL